MITKIFCFLLLAGLMSACKQETTPLVRTIPLTEEWVFYDHQSGNWHPAQVPGAIHTDLHRNGLIDDPFFGCNEQDLQWIGRNDWVYKTAFQLKEEDFGAENISLVFEGLDTYADVYLNNQKVLEAKNMFRTWEIPCNENLRPGENNLEIRFQSAENRFLKDSAAHPYPLPGGRWVFARKAAYHFGWDWGPKFVTAGIWKPVYLKILNSHDVEDIYLTTKSVNQSKARISAKLTINAYEAESATVRIFNRTDDKIITKKNILLKPDQDEYQVDFDINDPVLWWCNGLGEPHLYKLLFEIKTASGEVFTERFDYGIRTIELVREPDEFGTSFYVKINDKPVFMKGANIIPPHSFMPETGRQDYEKLVQLAVESNMNMLRVWGGGVYKDDVFYQLCDEKGILVWQDFMFACAMYPGDDDFVENVRQEAIDQVKRLRNHTSLALWCGNNEVDEGWHNWGWQRQYDLSDEDSAAIWTGYKKIFHEILPEVINTLDHKRQYTSTSPMHGWGRKESLSEGPAHYWGVWWGQEPFGVYLDKVPRFMSEYGFQAMPSLSAIRTIQPQEKDTLFSDALRCHQKHPTGFETIDLYLEREGLFPETLEQYIYFSQIIQAMGITTAIEAHRRAKPRCMGTLYWQLNDCWPVTSWSGTDFHGNHKALQYAVKNSFRDILVSILRQDTVGYVYLVSDSPLPVSGMLELSVHHFDGNLIWQYEKPIEVPASSSTEVANFTTNTMLDGFRPEQCIMHARFTSSDKTGYRSQVFFEKYGDLMLPESALEYEVRSTPDGAEITVRTKTFAAFVHLFLTGSHAVFSNNFFHLMPGETATISCKSELSEMEFKQQLRVMDLRKYLDTTKE
jgi:beta-mannosidase